MRNALAQPRHDMPDRVVWVELGTALRTDTATVERWLERAVCQLGVDRAFDSLKPSESFDEETIERIAAGLDAVVGHATLVFDGFQRVGRPLAAQLAAILTSWSDDRRQVIVCTRTWRSELAAVWPLRDGLFVAGPDELRLQAEEIAELLGVLASERRMVCVVADSPADMWEREEIQTPRPAAPE